MSQVDLSVDQQMTNPSNSRLHTDEQLRGACGAPPSLAGEANVGPQPDILVKTTRG